MSNDISLRSAAGRFFLSELSRDELIRSTARDIQIDRLPNGDGGRAKFFSRPQIVESVPAVRAKPRLTLCG